MNAHQRRKSWRRIERASRNNSRPLFIRNWSDLAKVPDSETHHLKIDVQGCYGWIHAKGEKGRQRHYLSTHTFYSSHYKGSTLVLRECGFNVTCANWDEVGK